MAITFVELLQDCEAWEAKIQGRGMQPLVSIIFHPYIPFGEVIFHTCVIYTTDVHLHFSAFN